MSFKKEFEYTGSVQSFVVPKTGYYLLEAWGAQGGNTYSAHWIENFSGGFGAFSTGVAIIKEMRNKIFCCLTKRRQSNKLI